MSRVPPRLGTTADRHRLHRLRRGITATWWYTATAVIFFEVVLVGVWTAALFEAGRSGATLAIVGIGGLVWWASTLPVLWDYRHRDDDAPWSRWPLVAIPLAIAAAYGAAAGVATGLWLLAALPLVQTLSLLDWPAGVRVRAVAVATALLAALWFVDGRGAFPADAATSWWLLGFYSTFLPAMSVLSLWWWDVLITVDRARASEARLAATQERLRVATDVHDLQGHHLQVIALQLELAERLMPTDPDAAIGHLRTARTSVDDARQGTRDLATRFRSVPLGDEIANAVDLLRAAGIGAEADVDSDADRAPASVLGPIIRETTTNVLRHGGGHWARLTLARDGAHWRYEIANDAADATPTPDGSGLEGIARRVDDAGGALDVRRGPEEFAVVVHIPAIAEVGG